MDEIQSLKHGFNVALSPINIGLMFIGVILGVIIGVLPGLGGANGVAILLRMAKLSLFRFPRLFSLDLEV